MNIQLHSTTKIVQLKTTEGTMPARIWEGVTEKGIPIHAYITRVAVQKDLDASELEKELQEHEPPSVDIQNIPLSMII